MCSPAGHALVAISLGAARSKSGIAIPYIVFCIFSGVAADLDFLAGWYLGDINGYHHLGSHSLAAAVGYGLVVGVLCMLSPGNRIPARDWGITGGLAYLSHIVLDLFARDDSEPIGMQLFWPISEAYYSSPVFVFPKFMHHTAGGDMAGMIAGLFNMHNLFTILLELVLLLPITVYLIRSANRRAIENE